MKKYRKIDYRFAPACYWDEPEDTLAQLLRNVQGTARREMIRDYWQAGQIDLLQEELKLAVVPEGLRESLGRIAPSFMGGEYLPAYLPSEVEIAWVELESTTHDVISVRARPDLDGAILYRVVDEYETKYELDPARTETPLTLERLISLLDSTDEQGLVLRLIHNNLVNGGQDPEELRTFATAKSEIYWELSAHYKHAVAEYIAGYKHEKETTL